MTEIDRLACRPDTLFAYGSLTFPEVLDAVLGRIPKHRLASVAGWRAAALRDRPFPVLVPGSGSVRGMVLTGLDSTEWRIVDAFEAPSYDLRRLAIDGGGYTWSYVAGAAATEWGVLESAWDRDGFAAHDLPDYLARCTAWRRRIPELPDPGIVSTDSARHAQ